LINALNSTGDEIVKENDDQEDLPVLDILVRKILASSRFITVMDCKDEESNTEDDAPGSRDDERPSNCWNKSIVSNG
jgi:hypothetical protein